MSDSGGVTDLQRLKQEVLSREASAALPCNLPLEWLQIIARDIDRAFACETPAEASAHYLAAPLALVGHLLCGQAKADFASVDLETLLRYCELYRTEVAIEWVGRSTSIHAKPATLQTIFSDREVEFSSVD
jgi:hypothetical protein